MLIKYQKVQRLKKILDMLVYGSTCIDIVIASLTALAIGGAADLSFILPEINILLTIVVVLSVVVGISFLATLHYDKILRNTLAATSIVKSTFKKITDKPLTYKYKKWHLPVFLSIASVVDIFLFSRIISQYVGIPISKTLSTAQKLGDNSLKFIRQLIA